MLIHQVRSNFGKNGFCNLGSRSLFQHFCGISRCSVNAAGEISDHLCGGDDGMRKYQVVVAATREMGVGKDGKLPWRLPSDLKFFRELTLTTSDPLKKNAVVMGRRTWDSIPLEYKPLPGRLNVVLTRSGSFNSETGENVEICRSIAAALQVLAKAPYCVTIEKVFVIGGGQILRETLNAPGCEAIHITEIGTSIDCDTFIPPIDFSCFKLWYSSAPIVENNIQFSFVTYVRVRNSATASLSADAETKPNGGSNTENFVTNKFGLLPKMILKRHDEYEYLRLVHEIISRSKRKDDQERTSTLSISSCQMQFNLRKSFPLFTTKRILWLEVVKQVLEFIHRTAAKSVMIEGQEEVSDKFSDIIDNIKYRPDCRQITLTLRNFSDLKFEVHPPCHTVAQFCAVNGELSCQINQGYADMGLTVPCNIASYALLTCIIAHICDLIPGDLFYVISDARINQTHIRSLQEQLQKLPEPFPILRINPRKNIRSFVESDLELLGYDPPLED